MSDKIAIMNKGQVVQLGTPKEVYNRPASKFVAEFLGDINLIKGQMKGKTDNGLHNLALTSLGINLPYPGSLPNGCKAGDVVEVALRPTDVQTFHELNGLHGQEFKNLCEGRVVEVEYLGHSSMLRVEAGGETLLVQEKQLVDYHVGQKIWLKIDSDRLILFPCE
ncbi:MAG: TOBE domain-containing protein [Thermincola sp.]|jgi:ABC-type Fe3+/spermidine/putrescine transport system ATPase subunit|nr:TOBE domain-containing protein [Thermincola sp.]MDT3704176.1 TOBE domain-containing protein [Thermincola sp.]